MAVGLDGETPDFVDGLARRLRGPILPAEDGAIPARWRATLDRAVRQIGEYFAGRRRRCDVPIDLRVSNWDRLVLNGAARLTFGETASYGELARRIGRPGAAQAVGQRRFANGSSFATVYAELACVPGDFGFLAVNFIG